MTEEEYIRQNYGTCNNKTCICIRTKWIGTMCEHWKPIGYISFNQMYKDLKYQLDERRSK